VGRFYEKRLCIVEKKPKAPLNVGLNTKGERWKNVLEVQANRSFDVGKDREVSSRKLSVYIERLLDYRPHKERYWNN
jgi:hypothetical protein